MRRRSTQALPRQLGALQQRFARWRETRKPRARIPEPLWTAAAKLAAEFGVHPTAKALRLNYDALKSRTASAGEAGSAKTDQPTFLEVLAPHGADGAECLVELEDTHGAKMRIHLKGIRAADIGALAQSFLRAER